MAFLSILFLNSLRLSLSDHMLNNFCFNIFFLFFYRDVLHFQIFLGLIFEKPNQSLESGNDRGASFRTCDEIKRESSGDEVIGKQLALRRLVYMKERIRNYVVCISSCFSTDEHLDVKQRDRSKKVLLCLSLVECVITKFAREKKH